MSQQPPEISHLKVDDIVTIIKESAASEIEKNRAFVAVFMEQIDRISTIDSADVEKITKLMGGIAKGDGGCSGCAGGCC